MGWSADEIDTESAHSARMYDYFLGGKDNYPPDQKAAEKVLLVLPNARTIAKNNRYFMRRSARMLAEEAGIRQFLDIGTGIPTSPNLHEVIQRIAPESRIVYTDNDPIVLTHARALLTSDPQGKTAYAEADLRDPGSILNAPELLETLDMSKPVALMMISILHFVPPEYDHYAILDELVSALPPGSYLALTNGTADFAPEEMKRAADVYAASRVPVRQRPKNEIERFFHGLELVEPGVVPIHRWRPDAPSLGELTDAEVSMYGGVARKP
ncbi:SAM-dependent methyltransferase [Streptomyces sp. NPDC097640]|uniref:SAM-dependent methyltransferase n=1 Tax=Streptomyces sp. NPDC097640 TaxID=3157229 RepID=UPI0033337B60